MYPSKTSQMQIDEWSKEEWEHFRQRLFDVSELMRNIQAAFARWYNRNNQRRGRFWADRFKSVYLENEAAVLDCMLYVELNPVRAGLVERPEDWHGSSIFLRDIGKADWLMPLSEILDQPSEEKALIEFRWRMYHRGSVPTKPGQATISQEAARGFATRGVYRKRLAYLPNHPPTRTRRPLRALPPLPPAGSSTALPSAQSSSSAINSPECARMASIFDERTPYPILVEYTCHFESNAAQSDTRASPGGRQHTKDLSRPPLCPLHSSVLPDKYCQ
jgi:hypothetical protein